MRRLFPALLRLAAGSEPVAQQLFRELVLALVHWFTRSARKCADVMRAFTCCRSTDVPMLQRRTTAKPKSTQRCQLLVCASLPSVASHSAKQTMALSCHGHFSVGQHVH